MHIKNIVRLAFLTIAALVVINSSGRMYATDYPIKEDPHIHAGFIIVKDGEIIDFSGPEYMKVEPCALDSNDELTPEQEQLEKAHLHDGIGDVVHVHREHATWGDLFENAGISFDEDLITYVNGNPYDGDITNKEIESYESVVIFEGIEPLDKQSFLEQSVTREHIEEVEKMSEYCNE